MKRFFLTLLLAIGLVSLRSSAQVSLVKNIVLQPLWGPVGYDHVDYYYLPDVESYYHVPKKQFIYLNNGKWNYTGSLPSKYRGYDLYNGYKVIINSKDAYRNFNTHKVRYAKYKKVKGQKAIKYSNDARYYVVKGHPHGKASVQTKKTHSKGSGVGNVKGNGAGKSNGKGKH